MAGVQIHVNISGLEQLQRRIDRLLKPDRRRLLDAVGAEVESQTRRRLSTEKTGPDRKPWQALSSGYAAWKRKLFGGIGILELHGGLTDSIQHLLSGGQVEVGSNLPYAAIQQFGGAEVGRPSHPPRPYLGLSAENEQDLVRVVHDFFERLAS
jgi:phage virion morphogenesis protein